jgi:hypothetical protein
MYGIHKILWYLQDIVEFDNELLQNISIFLFEMKVLNQIMLLI